MKLGMGVWVGWEYRGKWGGDGKVDGRFLGRGGSLKMGVDSGGGGVGGAGSSLSSFSFFSFFFSGVVWMGGFQSQGPLKHSLFLGKREEWKGGRGRRRGGGGGRNLRW